MSQNRWVSNALITVLVIWAVDCTPSVPTGTVVGQAVYKGVPVPEGCLVTFISNSGFATLGTVDAKGEYKVSVTVPGVDGPEMSDEDERKFMAGDPTTVAKFSQKQQKRPIPEKYSDMVRSDLSFEIKAGSNTYDIDLK